MARSPSKPKDAVCFLCGGPGADSKDHIPPKTLLPSGVPAGFAERWTLRAHARCNQAGSKDEEYLRELLAPTLADDPRAADVVERMSRNLQRPEGQRLRRALTRRARAVNLISPGGLYVGRGVAVPVDHERTDRVGRKITRGTIFRDHGAFVPESSVKLTALRTEDMERERERGLTNGEPFWLSLASDGALHTAFAPGVVVRRAYMLERVTAAEIVVSAHVVVALYGHTFLGVAVEVVAAPGVPLLGRANPTNGDQ